MKPPVIVDLFAGPGGWSETLRVSGCAEVGIEWDTSACATRAAAGHRTIRADVAQFAVPTWTTVEGLIGSPPCQAFSNAGQRKGFDDIAHLFAHVHACQAAWHDIQPRDWSDPRAALILEPLRWVDGLTPRWVALEQVPPVLPLWEAMAGVLRGWGYSVWTGVLNAADFGVPQTRQRAIFMAARDRAVHPPEPTHARRPAPSLFGAELKPWVSMADALGWGIDDRPCLTVTSGGTATGGAEPIAHARRAAAAAAARGSWVVPTGANTMKHSRDPDEVELYERPITEPAPTVDGKAGGAWTLQSRFTYRDGEPIDEVLDVTVSPAVTLTGSSIRKGVWDVRGPNGESVKLELSDGLILQGFRPDYPVQGTRTKQWEQIGNAIPPPLAGAVLGQLR